MIKWSNLWNQFRLAPGTARYRIPLSLWQVGLMLASGAALLVYVGFSWARLGVMLGGFAGAWLAHELLFIAFAERVVGLRQLDFEYWRPEGYLRPCYIPQIERFFGAMISDAEKPKKNDVG